MSGVIWSRVWCFTVTAVEDETSQSCRILKGHRSMAGNKNENIQIV